MRFAFVMIFVLGCSGGSQDEPLVPLGCDVASPCPAGETSCALSLPSGLTKSCQCIDFGSGDPWWACSTCPFGEGTEPIACTMPGLGCNITNWEHDCDCTCTAEGWWSCAGGTVGSTCPKPPGQ